MKDQAKGLAEQFKNTPAIVVAAALLLAVAAFGVGLAAGNSNDSDSSADASHHGSKGFKHGDGQGYGGPGHGGVLNRPDPEALEKFQKCLKGEGVDLPSPGNPPSEKNRDKLRSAVEKCHKDLPSFQGRGGGPPGGGQGGPPGAPAGPPPGGGPGNYPN